MDSNNSDDVRLIPSPKEIWELSKDILIKKLSTPVFETWIKPAQIIEITAKEVTIGVNNEFMRSMLANYKNIIADSLNLILKYPVNLKIIVDTNIVNQEYTATISSISYSNDNKNTSPQQYNQKKSSYNYQIANLNEKNTFINFVVGSNNQFCHSAALAVAQKPGQAYNPFFIYGGVGLGKTHLMHAIGHEILNHSNSLNVKYISCERFTNDMVTSIRDDRMVDFRKRYRQIDVLLIDDIQFIQGKESTQEEFFHTFNALRESGKQIVISSDRLPKAIPLLEERLRSRFEWGLIADIQPADLETRVAILMKKCESEGLDLSSDILLYLANIYTVNIRELEGALTRIRAFSQLTKEPITIENLANKILTQNNSQTKKIITIEKIINAVAKTYKVEPAELISSRRSADITLPRHICMYLAHDLMNLSFSRIGEEFGNRKHSSIVYAHSRIKEAITKDSQLNFFIKQIIDKINA